MDKEVIKAEKQELAKSQVNNSTRHLLISIHKESPFEINKNIQQFKEGGIVKYEALLSIPVKDRLPGLVEQYGSQKIHGLLVVMLTDFCNFFNVIRPMSAEQITACAFEIINTANEDYLSIEDLVIFFNGAKNSKYGKIYDRLDQQTIFEMLEVYRQERHEKYLRIKEENDTQLKGLGPAERTVQTDELATSFYNVVGRLSEMKDRLKEQREINKASRL